ncbi:MAG: hypothetical protein ACI3ZL_01305 [Candidatus Cryptobacteroides sp.]
MRHTEYARYLILPIAILLLASQWGTVSAQDMAADSTAVVARTGSRQAKVRFAYDVDFELNFDNREYYKSNFSTSMTVFGARLTPAVGIDVRQKDGTDHKVMLGIDIMKDFGRAESVDLFRELTIYYQLRKKLGKTDLTLDAGIFPRRFMEGSYSTAFFSDSLRFYDTNIEGLLLKFRRPNARYEVGCDWMGMIEGSRRERFMIFFSGDGNLTPWLSLGYAGYMYHFANSEEVKGVVDNILLNPYVKADFASMTPFQALGIRVGWLQSFQQDRLNIGRYVFPCGGEICTDIRKWNVGIRNTLFFGTDMMPYYNNLDQGGIKYGSTLYMGDPFFRVFDDSSKGWGTYDRLEAYYEPRIRNYLSIRVSAIVHFNGGYSGFQQIVALRFNLSELLRK